MTHYALIMLAAGIGIPILAALNAALGRFIASPTTAAVVLFSVALICCVLFMFATSGSQALTRALDAPRYLLLGGALIAFYVLTITHIAPHFGIGNAVFFVLLGQLISAAAIDHFGLFGAQLTPLGWIRAVGIAVMAIGVWITQLA